MSNWMTFWLILDLGKMHLKHSNIIYWKYNVCSIFPCQRYYQLKGVRIRKKEKKCFCNIFNPKQQELN